MQILSGILLLYHTLSDNFHQEWEEYSGTSIATVTNYMTKAAKIWSVIFIATVILIKELVMATEQCGIRLKHLSSLVSLVRTSIIKILKVATDQDTTSSLMVPCKFTVEWHSSEDFYNNNLKLVTNQDTIVPMTNYH